MIRPYISGSLSIVPVILFLALISLLLPGRTVAQEAPFNVFSEHQHHLYTVDRLINSKLNLRHSAVKPMLATKIPELHSITDSVEPRHKSWFVRKLFYENLVQFQGKEFTFRIDPLFDFGAGYELENAEATWVNTRGLRIEGSIGKKIAFSSSLYENQAQLPAYIDRFINTWTIMPVVPGVGIMPGQGIVRQHKNGDAWDYANATGYISYSPFEILNFQFGHDRHFIGHGYRSLLLSDVSYPYPYFRMQVDFGPLQYTYWLMQHTDPGAQPLSFYHSFRKKYASMGYLNWQVSDKIQVGILQSLVWAGDDSIGGINPPSWQYMNPVVFLHPVHYGNGSEGNLFIGLNMQWEISHKRFLYGQLMFDEIKVNELLRQSGAATNKYGGQLGLKMFDAFGMDNFYLQGEWNVVRPYTYSHIRRLSNYAHYLQPLGHPSGANFSEVLLIADYHFKPAWYVAGKLVFNITGLDEDSLNYGSNIFRSYLDAPGGVDATGIRVGWGKESTLLHAELALGYLINPKTNMKLEAKYIYREQGPQSDRLLTNWFTIGIRTSLRNLYYDF
jgi:hypothetical protein